MQRRSLLQRAERARWCGYVAAAAAAAVWLAAAGVVIGVAFGHGSDPARALWQRHFGDGIEITRADITSHQNPGGVTSEVRADAPGLSLALGWRGAREHDRLTLVVSHYGQTVEELTGALDLQGRAWGMGRWSFSSGEGFLPGQWDVQVLCAERLLCVVPFTVLDPPDAFRFRVARLAVSTAYDEKLRQPLGITDVLPATTPDLFVHFEWADAPRGATLEMQVWREGRRRPEFDAEVELRENVRGVARSRLHQRGGFEPGQYETRFLSGKEVIGYRRFVVER